MQRVGINFLPLAKPVLPPQLMIDAASLIFLIFCSNPNRPVDVTKYLNTTWPEYTTTSQKYLEFSHDMTPDSVKQHFNARSTAFWTKLVPEILKDTTRHQPSHLPSPVDIIVG